MKARIAAIAMTLMAVIALTGAPASAAIVPCSSNEVISSWNAECKRRPYDDDAGGVSGSVRVEYSGNDSYYAAIQFEAKGEHIYLHNRTTTTAYLRLFIRRYGEWVAYVDYVMEARTSDYINEDLAEDMPLRLQVCILDRGCASLDTIRS